MTEQPEPEAPDAEYYRGKAYAVSQRSYRRLHGRGALRMLETAYATDVGKLCDRIERLETARWILMSHEEAKDRLLANPEVREAYENPPLLLAVARAVVERRKELGLTQEELAEKMGTSQAQVWRIESGNFNPTAKTLSRLEGTLGILVACTFSGEATEEDPP